MDDEGIELYVTCASCIIAQNNKRYVSKLGAIREV